MKPDTPAPPSLFSYKPYWAKRLTPAPVLPMSREEMDQLGWDVCDIILVTGDAYIDHPSFGAAIIGRLLESQGFRVGILSQPDWHSVEPFTQLGRPALFWGVTAGNMDSMVNHYTADRKIRREDAYSPDGKAGLRPDRATIVYSHRCRQAYPDVPIVLGGIEASLRRIAHYDYWQDKIRHSILADAKADYLCYGNAERPIVELAHLLARSERSTETLHSIRGTAVILSELPSAYRYLPVTPSSPPPQNSSTPYCLLLPSSEQVEQDKQLFALSVRTLYQEGAPYNGRPLTQAIQNRFLWLNPPAWPLTTSELDTVYTLPFTRLPHPAYKGKTLPAFEMIRHSVTLMRGCFGGCAFCSLAIHEGKTIQSRSLPSVLEELEQIRDTDPAFTGAISDLGGPSANMYQMGCSNEAARQRCRRASCLFPKPCPHLNSDHTALIDLYRQAKKLPGIKSLRVASGIRYDLALHSPEYIEELVRNFVGGYLKIAPEHTEHATLQQMHKPDIEIYEQFASLFDALSKKAGKEQYMIPYFIAAHPGCRDEDMLNLALWLKAHRFRLDQVQSFYPTPLTLASTAWYTGLDMNDRKLVKTIPVARGERQRRVHKAFLRYHDPANQKIIHDALVKLGRTDLIGFSKTCLVKPLRKAQTQTDPATDKASGSSTGRGSKQRVQVSPSGKRTSQRQATATPVGKSRKHPTTTTPAGKSSKHPTTATPAGKNSKRQTTATPAGKNSKRRTQKERKQK